MTIKQYFWVEESLNWQEKGLDSQQQSLHDCKIPQQFCESWQKICVFRPFFGLCTQIMEFEYKQTYKKIETGVLVWKSKSINPYQPILFTLVAICLKLNGELMCLTASLNLNAQKHWRTHTLGFRRKPNRISTLTRQPNLNHTILHYRSIPSQYIGG